MAVTLLPYHPRAAMVDRAKYTDLNTRGSIPIDLGRTWDLVWGLKQLVKHQGLGCRARSSEQRLGPWMVMQRSKDSEAVISSNSLVPLFGLAC